MYPLPPKIFAHLFIKQHWPTLDVGQCISPSTLIFFACFWIKATLANSGYWVMYPLPPQGQVRSRLGKFRLGQGQVKVKVKVKAKVRSRSGQGARMDGSDLTMIQVDLIHNVYPADNSAISPTAFLLVLKFVR